MKGIAGQDALSLPLTSVTEMSVFLCATKPIILVVMSPLMYEFTMNVNLTSSTQIAICSSQSNQCRSAVARVISATRPGCNDEYEVSAARLNVNRCVERLIWSQSGHRSEPAATSQSVR